MSVYRITAGSRLAVIATSKRNAVEALNWVAQMGNQSIEITAPDGSALTVSELELAAERESNQ